MSDENEVLSKIKQAVDTGNVLFCEADEVEEYRTEIDSIIVTIGKNPRRCFISTLSQLSDFDRPDRLAVRLFEIFGVKCTPTSYLVEIAKRMRAKP